MICDATFRDEGVPGANNSQTLHRHTEKDRSHRIGRPKHTIAEIRRNGSDTNHTQQGGAETGPKTHIIDPHFSATNAWYQVWLRRDTRNMNRLQSICDDDVHYPVGMGVIVSLPGDVTRFERWAERVSARAVRRFLFQAPLEFTIFSTLEGIIPKYLQSHPKSRYFNIILSLI